MKKAFLMVLVFCLVCVLGWAFPAFSRNKSWTNGIGMEFVPIPSGSFMMGCDQEIEKCAQNELPAHKVTITEPFYMGKYEVTQEAWQAVMGENPSAFKGWGMPVENVSWKDIQVFIGKLNAEEVAGRYRLPTEAEWEYAARAGSTAAWYFGDEAEQLGRYAWYNDNSGGKSHPVGEKEPNEWGLYDMYGNVWEWVRDWYADWYYGESPAADPEGPSPGSAKARVLRGGGWAHYGESCCSARRIGSMPDDRNANYGFRLVFIPDYGAR